MENRLFDYLPCTELHLFFKQLESEMAIDKKRTLNHSIYMFHTVWKFTR